MVSEGTQHGGGGDQLIFRSTKEQVNRALDLVINDFHFALNEDGLFADFGARELIKRMKIPLTPQDWLFHEFFVKASQSSSLNENSRAIVKNLRAASPVEVRRSFLKSKVNRLQTGKCNTGSRHTDASVSAYRIGSEICVSVEGLMATDPEQLVRQIYCLFLHEIVHLFGYENEEHAVAIQKSAYDFFGDFFGEKGAKQAQEEFLSELNKLNELLRVVTTFSSSSNFKTAVFDGVKYLKKVRAKLEDIHSAWRFRHYIQDEVLFDNFLFSYWVMEGLFIRLGIDSQVFLTASEDSDPGSNGLLADSDKLSKILFEIEYFRHHVKNSWSDYTGDQPPFCINPVDVIQALDALKHLSDSVGHDVLPKGVEKAYAKCVEVRDRRFALQKRDGNSVRAVARP